MIDDQETFNRFGYLPADVPRDKKVVAICGNCGLPREITKAAAINSKVCIRCQRVMQAKHIATVNRFGRKHSEETKKKIGEANFVSQKRGKDSPNYGRKLSEERKNTLIEMSRNRVWTPEDRKRVSDRQKGTKASPETRKKMSEMRLAKPTRIGHKAAHGKGQFYTSKAGENIWMRSSWELKTAKYLDENGVSWKHEPEAFPIQYVIDGLAKIGTYRPDFLVEQGGKVEYWEIKGWWRDDALIKYTAFVSQYPELIVKVFGRQELNDMNIL
jgi:hypothetical protein